MAIQDKILFLGPEGTYTHQAALKTFPSAPTTHLQPAPEISSVFDGVQSGSATHGVVPIENSTNGIVTATWDLLASSSSSTTDVLICGEAFVPVRHALLGRRCPTQNPVAAGASGNPCLAHIRTLHSHPQAWGQCKGLLASPALRRAQRVDAASTARAAALAAADASGATAAIASEVAARACGLDVLMPDVSDCGGNATRFFVLRRAGGKVDDPGASGEGEGAEGRWRALVAFTLKEPSRVSEALGVFGKRGVPVVNVVARPSVGGEAWERVFLVEIVLGGKGSAAVEAALVDLGNIVPGWRWLGSWESKLGELEK